MQLVMKRIVGCQRVWTTSRPKRTIENLAKMPGGGTLQGADVSIKVERGRVEVLMVTIAASTSHYDEGLAVRCEFTDISHHITSHHTDQEELVS